MSWTLSGVVEQPGEVDTLTGSTDVTPEMELQIIKAKEAAREFLYSGAVGDGPYVVSLNGHANPDHNPTEGWVNDFINVSVSQKRE